MQVQIWDKSPDKYFFHDPVPLTYISKRYLS